ncbi:diguanylate cyclase, partial [Roseibium hamelinense]
PSAKGLRLEIQIYLFAGLLIVVALAAFVFIGLTASREADRLALVSDKHLLSRALADQQTLLAVQMHPLSINDRSVEKISRAFDKAYIRDQIMQPLLAGGRADRIFLINASGQVVADASDGSTRFIPYDLDAGTRLFDLADTAQSRFASDVFEHDGGFSRVPSDRNSAELDAVFAFDLLNERPALFAAMPIAPHEGGMLLPSKVPHVLIALRHLDPEFAEELNSTLSLRDFRFLADEPRRIRVTDYQLSNVSGDFVGLFAWDVDKPGAVIWHMLLPMAGVFGVLLAGAAFFTARKIGGLTRSLEESEKRNRHSALHDALTGLANRVQFTDRLNFGLENLQEQPVTLIAGDLDRFKAINDTHGHAAGDVVICATADRLKAVVGSHGLVGRIGGDEFVILINSDLGTDGLSTLCRQILASIHGPIQIAGGQHVDVGMSLGIARAPASGHTETSLMKAADAALYAAKSSGRDTFVFAEQLPKNDRAKRTAT